MNRILLVDDETEICQLLCAMLERTGAKCVSANSMAQGRLAIKENQFDAIFLDVNLPDGLGYQLIPEIKDKMPDASCIAISAMDSERKNALTAGADIFISKPFSRNDIFATIRNLGFQA